MANVAVTNTFVAGTSAVSAQVNTNFSDIVTWLNNRNVGSDTWGYMKVTATVANPVVITSSAATTEVSIDNTATDGDPLLTFKFSGSTAFTVGADDTDDFLKFATSALTTNVAFQIPSGGAQVQFNVGSAGTPSISFIGDPNTGISWSNTDEFVFSSGGTSKFYVGSYGILMASNTAVQIQDGSVASPSLTFPADSDTGIFRAGANDLRITCGGSATAIFDTTAIYGRDGAAGNPSFTFISDSDTGIYRPGTNLIGFTCGGSQKFEIGSAIFSFVNLNPVSDNLYTLGDNAHRWSAVWAANGTIQTCLSSTKTNIEPVLVAEAVVPEAIYFSRPEDSSGKQQLGFLADNLPEECFAILPDGTRSETDVYTSSVVGILCSQVKSLLERIAALESK